MFKIIIHVFICILMFKIIIHAFQMDINCILMIIIHVFQKDFNEILFKIVFQSYTFISKRFYLHFNLIL